MKKLIKKILKEEFEDDLGWMRDQNPKPWEEFMFPYIDLKPKLENTKYGEMMVYRDHSGEWVFFHKQNPKNGYVWFNYNKIWLVFRDKFGFEYKETQGLLGRWLGEHYNLRGVTPEPESFQNIQLLGEHYNLGNN
jgi:hypothetical protein